MKITLKNNLFRFFIDDFAKKGILSILSDKQFAAFEYLVMTGNIVNFANPVTFTEKLQWIKVYGGLEKYTEYADKNEVREFIKKTIGKEYLVPIYGIWDKFEDIPFDKLPQKFVIKATHGSAYVYVCKDKSLLDMKLLKNTVNRWLNENFYKKTREKQYLDCTPKIICEKYLEDENGDLIDYKIFCYNGEPRIIEVVWDRFTDHKGDVYKDLSWNTLNISYTGQPYSRKELIKPDNLKDMLDISRKLSKQFPFVRVDLYSIKNKIYFGELTFTPANGMERFDPPQAEYLLGEQIDLSKYNAIKVADMKVPFTNKLLTFGHNILIGKVFRYLPDKQVNALEYLIFKRKILRLDHPKSFTEKIQWAKTYGHLERYTNYVDKYKVRDIISQMIGKKYLIPLLGVWNSFREIDFARLPRQFVLKATHGSHYIFMCKDKSSLNKKALEKTVTGWLNESFYRKFREDQYRDCQPRIICEPYLEDESGELIDYKIFCFNGIPHFIEVYSDRSGGTKTDYMDLNWHKLPIICVGNPNSTKLLKKPRKLKAMLNIAKILSKPFPFVRVDLYLVKDRVYFGELTFTPANGIDEYNPPEVDYQLGELMDLSKYNYN